VMWITTKI